MILPRSKPGAPPLAHVSLLTTPIALSYHYLEQDRRPSRAPPKSVPMWPLRFPPRHAAA